MGWLKPEIEPNMPGPQRTRTNSAKKRYQIEYGKKRRAKTVNLGDESERWKELKTEIGTESDVVVAKALIDRYREHETKRRKLPVKTAERESPPSSDVGSVVMSGVEFLPSSSESEGRSSKRLKNKKRLTSTPVVGTHTFESDSELSVVSSVGLPIQSHAPEGHVVKEATVPVLANQSVSFENTLVDAGVLYDPDDVSYIPSEPDMSINVTAPNDYREEEAVVIDLDEEVFDIEAAFEDEPEPETSRRHILHSFTPNDEQDEMFLVSSSCLDKLVHMPRKTSCNRGSCGQPVAVRRRKRGSGLVLTWECTSKHESQYWTSQPVLPNGVMVGNFKFSASVTMSGNNFSKIALMAKFLRLNIPSMTMFDNIQAHYVIPEVDRYWNVLKKSAQEEWRATDIVISGDGRMDSPGHCAKYCTYTIQNQADKKILAMEIVDKREVDLKSGRLEARGFEKAMADLKESGAIIKEVVTDAHPQITAMMKKNFPEIRHSWDMWHGAKNLAKKLNAVAIERGNENLKPWVKDITNHFFYSAETCNGDMDTLQSKFASLMNHTLNVHKWALGRCEHDPIEEDEEKDEKWLHPEDPAVPALERVVMDARFQSNLGKYVTCQTTSELESFNNHLLMYVSKRHAFSFPVYKCRCQLAAIDYVEHLGRALKKNKKGEYYYCRSYSKAANHWTFKHVKEPKAYQYIPEMLSNIIDGYINSHKEKPLTQARQRQPDDPRLIASTIAPTAPPPTKELVSQRVSRLKKESWPKPGTSGQN